MLVTVMQKRRRFAIIRNMEMWDRYSAPYEEKIL